MADGDLPAPAHGMVLTALLIVADQDRSRAFYQDVLGAKVVLERDPCILQFHNSWTADARSAATSATRTATSSRSARALDSGDHDSALQSGDDLR
jgi:catechol 2,3-dioxygenase-like lactoylglutathione lyase family enzyme